MPTSKSDLASRASMVTGLSCSAAVPPQLENHSQCNLGTAHRGGGRNVWTSPGNDPDLLEVAAAAESAISASALIIRRHAMYYGHDPEPRLRQSRQRRDMLDVLIREQAVKQITNPARWFPPNYRRFRQRTPGQPWTSGADMAMSAATQNPMICTPSLMMGMKSMAAPNGGYARGLPRPLDHAP
jgi:hypothetical protein